MTTILIMVVMALALCRIGYQVGFDEGRKAQDEPEDEDELEEALWEL